MTSGSDGTRGRAETLRAWWSRLRGPVAQDGIVLVPLMVFLTLDRRAPEWWSSDVGALVLIGGLAIVRTAAIVMRRRGVIGRAAVWATAGLAAVAGLGISLAVTLILSPTLGLVLLVAVAVAMICAAMIFMRWRRLRAGGAGRGASALQALAAVAGSGVVWLLIWSLDAAPWAIVAALMIAAGVIIAIRLRGLRAAIWGARKSALARRLALIGSSIMCLIGSLVICGLVCASLTFIANLLSGVQRQFGRPSLSVWKTIISERGGTVGPQLRAARDFAHGALTTPPPPQPPSPYAREGGFAGGLLTLMEIREHEIAWNATARWLIFLAALTVLFDRLMRDAFWRKNSVFEQAAAPSEKRDGLGRPSSETPPPINGVGGGPRFDLLTLLAAVALFAVYLGVVTAVPQALRPSWLLAPALLKTISVARSCRTRGTALTRSDCVLVFAVAAAMTLSIVGAAAALTAFSDCCAYGEQCVHVRASPSIFSRARSRYAAWAECGYVFRNASLLLIASGLILWRSSRLLTPRIAAMTSARRTWTVRFALVMSCLTAAGIAYWLRAPRPRFVWPSANIAALKFSPDGASLAAIELPGGLGPNEHRLRVFNVGNGGEKSLPAVALPGAYPPVARLQFTPGGELWVQPKEDSSWGFLNATTRRLQTFSPGAELWWLSPDGKSVATYAGPRILAMWDAATGQRRFKASAGGFDLRAAAFSPDSRAFATAGHAFVPKPAARIDNWLDLWNVVTGKSRRLKIETPDWLNEPVSMIAFSDHGPELAIVQLSDGSVPAYLQVWDFPRRKKIAGFKLFQPPSTANRDSDRVVSIAFDPRGRPIVNYSDILLGYSKSELWDIAKSPATLILTSNATIAFSAQGDMLAVKGYRADGANGDFDAIDVLKVSSLSRVANFHMPKEFTPEHLQFLPDRDTLLVVGRRSPFFDMVDLGRDSAVEVGLGDVRTGTWTESTLPRAVAFAVAPDGKAIATIQQDGTTALWKIPP